jgi:hypothetical protein
MPILAPPNPGFAAARQSAQPVGPPPSTDRLLPPSQESTVPSIGLSSPQPQVKAPLGTSTGDISERARLLNTGTGVHQIQDHPVLKAAAGIGDYLLSNLLPGPASQIPGTTAHHNFLLGQNTKQTATDLGNEQKQATTAKTQADVPLEQATTAHTAEETSEMPAKAASEEGLQGAQAESYKNPKPKTDFELWRQDNPTGTAQDFQAMQAKPLTQDEADSRNAVWDRIASQYHLPTGQFKAGMPSADAAQLAGSMNNVISRGQGAQSITIKQEAANKGGDARADKSFQYNQGELDKLTNPISQLTMRMGRMQDTLNQGSPQADALVGPELLTVMAGGQGSGLRMNEAEIARVVGGRSNWETLKANINKWSLNPETANSITPDQRQQIRALVKTVGEKLNAKQEILNQAAGDLVNTDDPKEHRMITQKARLALNAIDEGNQQGGGNQPQRPAGVPDGYNWNPQGNGGKGSWQPPKQ